MSKTYLLLLCIGLSANVYSQTQTKKSLEVPEIPEAAVNLDGVLDEVCWAQSAVIEELDQYFPEPKNAPDGVRSDVRLFYTQKGLYVGGVFSDDRAPILSQLTQRDRINANTDWIQLIINPFNDGANDFNFYLSAAGVQGDARAIGPDREDGNWNAVWYSKTLKSDHQWSFELFIPYRALRIPKTGINESAKAWGFNFKRSIRSDRTMYSWNPIDRNFENESLQSGELLGIRITNPPLRVSLRPNATSTLQSGGDGTTRWNNNAGADIKIGLNKSFTLDMTLLPDFSQVAYDQQFVNFEPFEQRFDENRQFFTEGVNLFSKGDLFYSRRIGGNPKNFTNANLADLSNTTQSFTRMLNATKLTGTTDNNLSVGVLNAITAANYALGEDSLGNPISILTEPLTNYNVVAFDQRLNNNSSIGLINTHVLRSNESGPTRDARTTAITGNLNFLKNSHFWNVSAAQSQIYDIEEPYSGESVEWELGKQVGSWRWEHELNFTTADFDPNDMGFQRRANRIHQDFQVSHQILTPRKNLLRSRNTLELQYRRLFDPNVFERMHVEYSHFSLTKNFVAYRYKLEVRPAEYDYFDPRVWGRYRINPSSMWHDFFVSTDYRKPLAIDVGAGYWQWSDYDAGGYYGNVKLLGRVSDQLNFTARIDMNHFNQIGWAQTISTDSIGMAVRTNRKLAQTLSGTYLFGPNSYVTLDLRHTWNRFDPIGTYHLNNDGTMSPSSAYTDPELRINIFNMDLKYVLWFAPGRELNLLYRASMAHADNESQLAYWQNIQDLSGRPTDHVFSLRLVYFLDYADIVK
jgi:hypothetical protein